MKKEGDFRIDGIMEGPGLHLVAYYCSLEHLLLKSAVFIKQGLELGEKCLFSIAPENHTFLEEILANTGVDVKARKAKGQLVPLDFGAMYEVYRTEGSHGLDGCLKELWGKSLEEGYTGVRIIVDTNYGILQVDTEHYLQWEKDLDSILMRVPIVNLCLYDIENLLTRDCTSSSKMITRTMDCHRYFLNENKIIHADYFKKKGA